MTLPAHIIAELDQRSKQAGDALDGLLDVARVMLAMDMPAAVVAEIIANAADRGSVTRGQIATGYGYAIVRLAQCGEPS